MFLRITLVCVWVLESALGFAPLPLLCSNCHRKPITTTTTTTTLRYKVLGAPEEGSYKPSVLEEGTNKIVTGNLSGSSFYERRREQTERIKAENRAKEQQQSDSTLQQQQTYSPYDSTPTVDAAQSDLHVEQLRHWDGVLELAKKPLEDDGSVCVRGTPWEGSTVLADFMTNPESGMGAWEDMMVLELGCGIGTSTIVAAMSGARVVATDADPTALTLTQQNVDKYQDYYKYPVQVASLVWGDMNTAYQLCQGEYPNYILAADVTYLGSDIESLRATLEAICGPETWICLVHTWRDVDEEQYILDSFLDSFERFDMDVALLPPVFQEYRPDGRTPVSIFMYRRRQ